MSALRSVFGDLRYTPPSWMQRFGPRRFLFVCLLLVAAAASVLAVGQYLASRPQPPGIVAELRPPGITPLVDGRPAPEPLRIEFSVEADPQSPMRTVDSVAPLDRIGGAAGSGVDMQPPMPGNWRWRSGTELVFEPGEDWPAGQRYEVRFDEALFAPNLRLRDDEASFTTPAFGVSIEGLEYYRNPVDRSDRRIVATLDFTHPVDPDSLEDELSVTMRESDETIRTAPRDLERTIRYDRAGRTAYVHTEIVPVQPQQNFATLTLGKRLAPKHGPSRLGDDLRESAIVPDAQSFFRVTQLDSTIARDEEDQPWQALTIAFTDRVATGELQRSVGTWLLPEEVTIQGVVHENRHWSSPREVTDEVLAQSAEVAIELDPVTGDASDLHSARLDVPENRYLYVRIDAGVTSEGEFPLAVPFDTVVRSGTYPKEVNVAQAGSVLPMTGSPRLMFVSRGVPALKVEVGRVIESEINHLASQSGGDFRSPMFRNYRFNEDNLTVRSERFIDLDATVHPREAVYSSLDLSEFLPDGGHYFINVRGWDRENDRPVGSADRRLVLVTDLGLLVKANVDSSRDVFVHSIRSGRPLAGAGVELLGKNGRPIVSGTTSAAGRATLPPVDEFRREKEPVAWVVRQGTDSIFMPYSDSDRSLQFSRFDTGGEYERPGGQEERLRALVFTDRGIYRPGESGHVALAVKSTDWEPLGALPLLFEVRDARGQTVIETPVTLPPGGFFEQEFSTQPSSATGNYQVALYLLDERERRRAIGHGSFRVEEFQPDRMRIRTRIIGQKPVGWINPGRLAAEVALENLFGTPAQARRVTGELELIPSAIHIPDHPDYRFDDPFFDPDVRRQPVHRPLTPATTDGDGIARFELPLGQYDTGIYRLRVTTEGFEEGGGRSVGATASVMMSPLDFLVGYKADGDLSWLGRDSTRSVHFVAVDSDAEATAVEGLTLSIGEERYVSTLIRRPNGTYAYQSVLRTHPRSSAPFPIAAEGSDYELPTDVPGSFVAELTAADGSVYSRVRYTVVGERNMAGDLERNAELDLKLEGTSFRAGDEIEFEVTAPYSGTGLVTIERDRVYAHRWFRTESTSTVQRIRIPEGLEGNAYVNVAFVRALDSPEIFVSPLSYAAAPFRIDRDARTVEIELEAPDLVRPGETLGINVRASRPSRLVLYAVDEGVLQVAGYTQPDPLAHFMPKMALQVATSQLVDLILPDFETFRQYAAPGGGAGADLAGANLNPFRRTSEPPVAFWSGIVDAGPDGTDLSFAVPDYYNGDVRIMAVAVSDAAVGHAAANTTIRGPFVITPNVLTAAAPGDEFEINVGLANNVEGSGEDAEVELRVSPSANLELVGEGLARLQIDEGGETRATFRLRALDEPGEGRLVFDASSAAESVRRTATLSVRPATARVSTMAAGTSDEDPVDLGFERELYPHYARQTAAASRSPLVLTDGMLEYLDAFPHACAEQIVSKVFPQLGFLGSRDATIDRDAIVDMFDRTVRLLRGRQAPDGSFRFWATSVEPHEFASVYIVHFLRDAQEVGLAVPGAMLDGGLQYIQGLASVDVRNIVDARLRAYAIYVLTRSGRVTTNYLTHLHEQLERIDPDGWRTDIAAAWMAASYSLLQQDRLGQALIGDYEMGAGDEMRTDFDTRLGRDAQYLYLLARHFPDRLERITAADIAGLTAPVMRNRFNTLSSAYTILALRAYTDAIERASVPSALGIAVMEGDSTRAVAESDAVVRAAIDTAIRELQVRGSGGDDIYYVLTQTGFDRTPPADAKSEGLELDRTYLDDDGNPVQTAEIGAELTVRLRVRSTGRRRTNVAVVDLLPGGFEVLTESVRGGHGGWRSDYRDVREDRVVIYGSFGDRVTEIRYRVRLTAAGDFVAPAAFAGSMYDRGIEARTAPGRFEVRPLR